MALALDASTPARVDKDTSGSTATTASFTAPANALLIAFYEQDSSGAVQTSFTDTGGLTWTRLYRLSSDTVGEANTPTPSGSGQGGYVTAMSATTSSQVSRTVTVTVTGAGGTQKEGTLHVKVFTDSAGAPTVGAIATNGATNSYPSHSVTTTAANSWVWAAAGDWYADGTATAGTNQTMVDTRDTTLYASHVWRQTNTTTNSGTNVTMNITAPISQAWNMGVIEILANSGGAGDAFPQPPTVAAVATVPAPAGYGQATAPVPIPVVFEADGADPALTASATTFPVAMPANVAENDLVVAFVGVKVREAVAPTATNWTLVATSVQFANDVAAGVGVGEQTLFAFARVAPAGGLSGTVNFTVPNGGLGDVANNTNGRAVAFHYDATGATGPTWDMTFANTSFAHVSQAQWGGTGAAGISLQANDYLLCALLEADDTARSATPAISLTATGATLGTVDDMGHNTVTTGGDSALSIIGAAVTAGSSNAAPQATLTGNASETGGGLFLRVRALGILGTPATPAPPVTAGVASVGTVTINRTAEVVATAVVAVATAEVPIVATGSAATAAPPVVVAVASAPAPTIKLDVTPAPPVVASVAAIPAPSISRGTAPTPPTVAVVGTVGAMTGAIATTVDGVTAAAVAAVPAPTVQTAGNASPQPPVVASVAAVSVPTMQLSATKVATTVDGVAAIAAPSIQRGTAPTPPTVAGVVATPAPTVVTQGNATVTPPVVSAVAAAAAPAIQRTATVLPPVVTEVTSVGIPTVSAGAGTTIPTTSVGASATIPAPSMITTATVVAATVNATTAIASPSVLASANILVPSVIGAADVSIPVFHLDSAVQAQTVLANVSIGLVVVTGDTVTPWYLWNGSTLVPMMATIWNGVTEDSVASVQIAP